jgi:putative transposase
VVDDTDSVVSSAQRASLWQSFFASLKKEHVYTKPRYRTRDEARADMFEYIEGFHNPLRRHSTLGHISPAEFERRFSTRCT